MVLFLKRYASALLFLGIPFSGVAQDYGLRFSSHGAVVDQRTTLQLGEDICAREKVRLKFDFRFERRSHGYFGYLFRMVTPKRLNIDLIFKPSSPNHKFHLVVGKKLKGTNFGISNVYAWNRVEVLLDIRQDMVQVITSDTTIAAHNVGFSDRECVKIVFGRSAIPGIQSIDLPPMVVRDVRLTVDGELRHHWPLNQAEGDIAYDTVSNVNATVVNPGWMLEDFQRWRLHRQLTFSGPVSAAFNARDEVVMIMSNDSLVAVPLTEQPSVSYDFHEEADFVFPGDQAVFHEGRNEFININPTHPGVTTYDFDDKSLRVDRTISPKMSKFWHYNKVLNEEQGTLFLVGGYGFLTYKNLARRYHIASDDWDTLQLKGDVIAPRYLFGLGNDNSEVSYLIGGYGSVTGDQVLYPQTFRDLYKIRWENSEVEKLYELPPEAEPFVFANSIVVVGDSVYYGLRFPRFQYKSHLQLVRGSLSKPEYYPIGDSIPFLFHDIKSFADLFYAEKSKLLVGIKTYFNDSVNATDVALYTISFPPIAVNPQQLHAGHAAEDNDSIVVALVGGAIVLGAIGLYFAVFRARGKPRAGTDETMSVTQVPEPVPAEQQTVGQEVDTAVSASPVANRIRFFGGFHVFNREGEEITNKFTPLLKELFLLIALNTLRDGKGISSQRLDEILWFDKTEKSARNNRSVNIAKLRLILSEVGFDLSKSTGHWKIEAIDEDARIDYADYQQLVGDRKLLSREQAEKLIGIVGKGAFLPNLEYEWLDSFKSAVSTEVITLLNSYLKTRDQKEDHSHVMDVVQCIYLFDAVDEEAMGMECRALIRMGNHTLAKVAYDKFRKQYFALYSQEYSKSFQEIADQ